jgi:undecaprenyl-diphosphatase
MTLMKRVWLTFLMCVIVLVVSSAASHPTQNVTPAPAEPTTNTLSTPKAVVLGIVEGLTEYLPVSSTGHLLVAERLMGIGQGKDKSATDTFTVVVQVGAIIAVLGIYRKRFVLMLEGVVGKSVEGRRTLASLVVAFIPAAVIGQLLGDTIKEHLLQPWPVVAAWFVGGVAILVFVANQSRIRVRVTSIDAITIQQAVLIGLAQTLALWPGTSRSLVTLIAALLLGISLPIAVEFAFLLGFITLSAATAKELLSNGSELFHTFGVLNPVIGTIVAGIAAWAAVRWMIGYLQNHPLTIFGWYRIVIAGIGAGLILGGAI